MSDPLAVALVIIVTIVGLISLGVTLHGIWLWSSPLRRPYSLRLPLYRRYQLTLYKLCVITRAPNSERNWYDDVGEEPDGRLTSVKRKTFEVGELFIVDAFEAQVGFPGRKPGKWDVDYKLFEMSQLEEAITLAGVVFERDLAIQRQSFQGRQ